MARSISWFDGDKAESEFPKIDIGRRSFVFGSDENIDNEVAVLPTRRSGVEYEAPIILSPFPNSQERVSVSTSQERNLKTYLIFNRTSLNKQAKPLMSTNP